MASTSDFNDQHSRIVVKPSSKNVNQDKTVASSSSIKNKDVRIVIPHKNQNPSQIERVSQPNSSKPTMSKSNNNSTKVKQESSREYKNYLEEMELRIRYMKNDIEFKTSQMSSKSKGDLAKPVFSRDGERLLTTWSRLQPHTFSQPSYQPSVTLDKRNKTLNNKGYSVSSFNPNNTMKKNQPNNFMNKCSATETKTAVMQSKVLNVKSTLLKSHTALYQSPNKRKVIYSSSFKQPITQTYCDFSNSTLPEPCHAASHPVNAFMDKYLTSQSSHAVTNDANVISLTNFSNDQQCNKQTTSTIQATHSLSGPVNIPVTQSPKPVVGSATVSRYKFVKPKSNPSFITQPVSQFPETNSTFSGINKAEQKQNIKLPSMETRSKLLENYADGRQQQCQSSKLLKKYPALKISTAAKLVSKYKLKRLSPTSATKIAPRFPTVLNKTTVSGAQTFRSSTTPTLRSKHRLIKPKDSSRISSTRCSELNPKIPITSDVSVRGETKMDARRILFTHGYNSACLINKKDLSPKERYACTSSENHSLPSSISSRYMWSDAFTLDKRNLRGKAPESGFNLNRKLIKIRKNSGNNGVASTNASRYKKYSTEKKIGASQYRWTEGQSASQRKGLKSSGGSLSSQYKWQHPSFAMQSRSIHNRQSVFKWQRPNSRNVNGLRTLIKKAQLKQRLKVMMAHRNNMLTSQSELRRNSSTTHTLLSHFTSPSKKGGVRGKAGVDRLVMIGQMLYRASSRKLTVANPVTSSDMTGGSKTIRDEGMNCGTTSTKQGFNTARTVTTDSSLHSPQTRMTPAVKFAESVVVKNLRPQRMKLVTVRGVRFHLEANGKKLSRVSDGPGQKKDHTTVNRVDIGGMTYVKTGPDTLELSSHGKRKLAASRALQKSLFIVAAKQKKGGNSLKRSKQRHCIFFCRFGKCQRGSSCPFIHDPEKVAVCTRFLRGRCEDAASCPFSHDASVHKMPVCLFYLRGLCSHEGCLYLHVKVSPDAPVCKDFLQGFCALGRECKKLHSFVCPSYAFSGKCPKGDRCPMLHRLNNTQWDKTSKAAKRIRKRKSQTVKNDSDICVKTKVCDNPINLTTSTAVPLLQSVLPSSSSTPSPSTSSHSIHLIPTTVSTLEAQPSFISLDSATLNSQAHYGNTTLSQSGQESTDFTPFTNTTTNQRLKITPKFINQDTQIAMRSCVHQELSKQKKTQTVATEGDSPVSMNNDQTIEPQICDASCKPLSLHPSSGSITSSSTLPPPQSPVEASTTPDHLPTTSCFNEEPIKKAMAKTKDIKTSEQSSSSSSLSSSSHGSFVTSDSTRSTSLSFPSSKEDCIKFESVKDTKPCSFAMEDCIKFNSESDTGGSKSDEGVHQPRKNPDCQSELSRKSTGILCATSGQDDDDSDKVGHNSVMKSTMYKGIIPNFMTNRIKNDNR